MTIASQQPSTELRRARWAALGIFLINGVVIASWVAHIPLIKERFGLSDGALGLTLLVIALGSIASLTLTDGVIARVGSCIINGVAVLAFCATLPLIVAVSSFPLLLVFLALYGVWIGAMEVAANVQAVAVEERYGRPTSVDGMSDAPAIALPTGPLMGLTLLELVCPTSCQCCLAPPDACPEFRREPVSPQLPQQVISAFWLAHP